VEEGALVRDSIIMNDGWIGRGAVLDRVILDKRVHVGARARVGHGDDMTPNRECPEHLSAGTTIVGKNTRLPEGVVVGRNCRIGNDLVEEDFPRGGLPSGSVLDLGSESPAGGSHRT
jgi:glucose-1-phosphate adenylyltransferase